MVLVGDVAERPAPNLTLATSLSWEKSSLAVSYRCTSHYSLQAPAQQAEQPKGQVRGANGFLAENDK